MAYTLSCCDDGSKTTVGTLIRFDNVTLLIDPSWHSESVTYEQSIKYWSTIVPQVDIILLSQPSIECLGAYALLYNNFYSHFYSRITTYATVPVSSLGRISSIEWYTTRAVIGPYESNELDLEDIENAFDAIKTIKYSQMIDLKSKYDGLTLTAYNSGVHAGGSIWCIMSYSEKLVYAKNWNHTRDNILYGAALLDNSGKPLATLVRSTGIITSLDKFGSTQSIVKRSKAFADTLRKSMKSNNTLVIPVDLSGKLLELLAQTHELFNTTRDGTFKNTQVLLVAYSRGRVLTYARSMLEWLSSALIKTWEAKENVSPFDLGKNFHVVTPDEISRYPSAKICFVSQVDTLVNQVFTSLSKTEKTCVLLTSSNYLEDGILQKLYNKWETEKLNSKSKEIKSVNYMESLTLKQITTSPLTGEDLEKHLLKLKERREKKTELEKSLKAENVNDASIFNSGSSGIKSFMIDEDDDDVEDGTEAGSAVGISSTFSKTATIIPVDTIIPEEASPKQKMFPFQPARVKSDEYGMFVDFSMLIQQESALPEDNRKRPLKFESDQIDDGENEDDPYDFTEPLKTNKRSRRSGQKSGSQKLTISNDNLQWLEPDQNPIRRTISELKVNIKCNVIYINMASLVDQRSASVIWPAFKPKKMILLGPPETQNQNVVSIFEKRSIDVVQMSRNSELEFVSTNKSLDISIDPALDELLRWQKIGDGHTIAHVTGRLIEEVRQQTSSTAHNPADKITKVAKMVLKPVENQTNIHTGISLSIGDIRLAEIKRKLTDKNHVAEFRGEGTLVVDGTVSVRKIGDGETVIDGPPTAIYETVKKALTDMLAKI